MGLFNSKKIDFDNIQSVVILEQTQIYKEKSNWGLSFGSNLGDSRVIAVNGGAVPTKTEIKFSITYKDGRQQIVKTTSETDLYDRLLQLAIDPVDKTTDEVSSNSNIKKNKEKVSIKKNQLPNGDYVIGRDIPPGIYDFTWVFGSGAIMKFKNEHDTTLGATTYFENIGAEYDYEFKQCLNVECKKGELLVINGNVVVEISKSREIELDL